MSCFGTVQPDSPAGWMFITLTRWERFKLWPATTSNRLRLPLNCNKQTPSFWTSPIAASEGNVQRFALVPSVIFRFQRNRNVSWVRTSSSKQDKSMIRKDCLISSANGSWFAVRRVNLRGIGTTWQVNVSTSFCCVWKGIIFVVAYLDVSISKHQVKTASNVQDYWWIFFNRE